MSSNSVVFSKKVSIYKRSLDYIPLQSRTANNMYSLRSKQELQKRANVSSDRNHIVFSLKSEARLLSCKPESQICQTPVSKFSFARTFDLPSDKGGTGDLRKKSFPMYGQLKTPNVCHRSQRNENVSKKQKMNCHVSKDRPDTALEKVGHPPDYKNYELRTAPLKTSKISMMTNLESKNLKKIFKSNSTNRTSISKICLKPQLKRNDIYSIDNKLVSEKFESPHADICVSLYPASLQLKSKDQTIEKYQFPPVGISNCIISAEIGRKWDADLLFSNHQRSASFAEVAPTTVSERYIKPCRSLSSSIIAPFSARSILKHDMSDVRKLKTVSFDESRNEVFIIESGRTEETLDLDDYSYRRSSANIILDSSFFDTYCLY
jgi:hypothetical protein